MKPVIVSRVIGVAASAALAIGVAAAIAPQQAAADSVWDRVAQCESTGQWDINTGNGYYGGLQFSPTTWSGFGGGQYAQYAHQASKSEQIAIARRVLAVQGPGAWPTCGPRAGLTKANGGADRNATAGSGGGQSAPDTAPKQSTPKQSTPKKSPERQGNVITVRSGDTLSKLARKHGTEGGWQAIAEANDLSNPNFIRIGQQLVLP
ncbi:transglycosylase family protein [Microlunatus sp. Y2014]|uniref:transglycosylase family protein n=1 Tax=Microlunatus sp. Y2014 TaxID=3418488 RepID=UPI003DA6CE43